MDRLLLLPVISEKAIAQSEQQTYTFKVPVDANKIEIARAVAEQFDVKVADVNTVKMKGKVKTTRTRRRQTVGKRIDYKKAYVTLVAGQKITLLEGA